MKHQTKMHFSKTISKIRGFQSRNLRQVSRCSCDLNTSHVKLTLTMVASSGKSVTASVIRHILLLQRDYGRYGMQQGE